MAAPGGEWVRFSASLNRMAEQLRASDAAGVSGAAAAVKRSIESHATSVGAGRLGVITTRVDTSAAVAHIKAKDGRAHMIERGTKAHEIKPDIAGRNRQIGRALQALFGQKTSKRRVRAKVRAGALYWSGAAHPITKPIRHPDTRARPFFWPGVEDALPHADDAYAASVARQAATAWR